MNTEDKQPKVNRVGSTAQRLAEKPYEKRLCRIECYPSCVKPGESYVGLSVEEWVDFIDEVGVEVQVVDGEINRGTPRFRSKMIPPHANVDNDRLPRFLGTGAPTGHPHSQLLSCDIHQAAQTASSGVADAVSGQWQTGA